MPAAYLGVAVGAGQVQAGGSRQLTNQPKPNQGQRGQTNCGGGGAKQGEGLASKRG